MLFIYYFAGEFLSRRVYLENLHEISFSTSLCRS